MNQHRLIELFKKINPKGTCRPSGANNMQISCIFKDRHARCDSHPSAVVSISEGRSQYMCFSCGMKGPLRRLIKYYVERTTYGLFRKDLIDFVKKHDHDTAGNVLATLYDDVVYQDYTAYYEALKPPGTIVKKFLHQKGIRRPEVINLFKEHNQKVLAIPYWKDDVCVGIKMRHVRGRMGSKYFMLKDLPFPTRELLWPEWVLTKKYKLMYLVEGELDAAHILQYNIPAISMGGSGWNPIKQERLFELYSPSALIVAMDNDEAGRKAYELVNKAITPEILIFNPKWKADPKTIDRRTIENEYEKRKRKL